MGSGHRRRSHTPLQVVPSVLSQQELIPGGCGQFWGSLWLPGAIESEHAPGKEPPSSPLSSLQPLSLVCPQPSLPREPQNPSPVPRGTNGHSPPQLGRWPVTHRGGTALLPLTWVQVKCYGYHVHLDRAALGCPQKLWNVPSHLPEQREDAGTSTPLGQALTVSPRPSLCHPSPLHVHFFFP